MDLKTQKPIQEVRLELEAAVRQFFSSRCYEEVETPVRIPVPAQELHIDAVCDGDMYLRTSPEFHMKRMLVDGAKRIFQIGPCYRDGERGRLHNPEFTMLEWYHVGLDYIQIAAETMELVKYAAKKVLGSEQMLWDGRCIDISGDWQISDIRDLFRKHAGWDPVLEFDADRFDIDLVDKVEPNLAPGSALFLKDFPTGASAFARIRDDVAERWELYIGGVEIANAYSELTDAGEQEARLELIAAQRRAMGKVVYPQDLEFLSAMKRGLPGCAGVALGIDRLAMLFAGAESIHAGPNTSIESC